MPSSTLISRETPIALRILRALLTGLIWLILGLANLWAAAALYFDSPFPSLRPALAIAFLVLIVALLFLLHGRAWKMLGWLACFAVVTTWWLSLKPASDRPWLAD